MNKCCIYCRVAGEATEANQLVMEAQSATLRETAELLGLQIVDERCFYEAGNNPTRESIVRLLDDARNGLFDSVLVKNPGRLGRDVQCLTEIGQAFHNAGLSVYTPEGEVHITTPAVAAYFRVATLDQILGDQVMEAAIQTLEHKGYTTQEASDLIMQCHSDMQTEGYKKPLEWYVDHIADKSIPELTGMSLQ